MKTLEEIKKKAEKYVRANSVYYGNDDYRLNMKDWLYFVEGLYNEATSQTKQELIEECICNEWDGKGISTCGFPCPVHNKNARDNRIHKEGFDAGYKKGYKVGYMEGWLNGIKKH